MTHREAERPKVALQSNASQANPRINVTPLIDVLLVVLIIFLVLTPLKPARFLAAVPSKPDQSMRVDPPPLGLVVSIKYDGSLMLNGVSDMGSVDDTSKLSTTLSDLFQQRLKNHAYSDRLRDRIDLPEAIRIEKTVFIKVRAQFPTAKSCAYSTASEARIDDLN